MPTKKPTTTPIAIDIPAVVTAPRFEPGYATVPPLNPAWEYLVITARENGTLASLGPDRTLDSLGEEGWELVAAVPTSYSQHLLYLKRKVG